MSAHLEPTSSLSLFQKRQHTDDLFNDSLWDTLLQETNVTLVCEQSSSLVCSMSHNAQRGSPSCCEFRNASRSDTVEDSLLLFFFDTAENDNEKWSQISPSVTRTIPTLLRKSGSHEEPHAQPALCNDVANALAAVHPNRLRQRLNKAARTWSLTLPELSRLWPWTKHSGSWQFRPTISLRLRLQARPNGRVLCPLLLWISPLLLPSCVFQSSTVVVGRPRSCSSIPLKGRHQRGVYGKLFRQRGSNLLVQSPAAVRLLDSLL